MLQVETGICLDNPSSYADLACADAYLVPRGLWPATCVHVDTDAGTEEADKELVARKEQALVRAFDWLNSLEWLGDAIDWERQPAWPRLNVPMPGKPDQFIGSDVVPRAVVQAQLEVAALIFNGTDMFSPKERGGKVVSESHSRSEGNIDVIGGDSQSDSYTYGEAAPVETFYPAVAALLAPFLAKVPGESHSARMVEAGRG